MDSENRETFRKKWPKMTDKTAENVPLRILCVFYGYFTVILWFRHPVRHIELSTYKGTKKVRETSDMVRVPTENTKGTKIKMHMKLDDKSQQITQITQIIESVKSLKSVDKDIKQQKTQKNTKKMVTIYKLTTN